MLYIRVDHLSIYIYVLHFGHFLDMEACYHLAVGRIASYAVIHLHDYVHAQLFSF